MVNRNFFFLMEYSVSLKKGSIILKNVWGIVISAKPQERLM